MKRISWLFVAVLVSASFLHAGDMNKDKGKNMTVTGDVCDAKCTYTISSFPREVLGCRKDCGVTSGQAVLVTKDGKMMKIDNPDMVHSYMGQHVKVHAQMMEEDTMHVLHINPFNEAAAEQKPGKEEQSPDK